LLHNAGECKERAPQKPQQTFDDAGHARRSSGVMGIIKKNNF
jgi:hypothetical protein